MWRHLFGIVRRSQCVVMQVHHLFIDWIFQRSESVGGLHRLHRLFIGFLVSSQIDFVCFAGIARGLPGPLMTIVMSLFSWVSGWLFQGVSAHSGCSRSELWPYWKSCSSSEDRSSLLSWISSWFMSRCCCFISRCRSLFYCSSARLYGSCPYGVLVCFGIRFLQSLAEWTLYPQICHTSFGLCFVLSSFCRFAGCLVSGLFMPLASSRWRPLQSCCLWLCFHSRSIFPQIA